MVFLSYVLSRSSDKCLLKHLTAFTGGNIRSNDQRFLSSYRIIPHLQWHSLQRDRNIVNDQEAAGHVNLIWKFNYIQKSPLSLVVG